MRKTSLNVVYDSSSDEDSERDRTPEPPLVKKRKLPTLSHSLTVPTPVDNPSLHQGRTRTIPYKEGQWATHVYVPVLLSRGTLLYKTVVDLLCSAKTRVSALHATSPVTDEILQKMNGDYIPADIKQDAVESVSVGQSITNLGPNIELHISLSRPLYLHTHQRQEFKLAVQSVALKASPTIASFAAIADLTNDERTRAFLALEVGAGYEQFKALADSLAPTLDGLRQDRYYEQPRFHASFAWALLDNSMIIPEPRVLSPRNTSVPPARMPALPSELASSLNKQFQGDGTSTSTTARMFEVDRICVRMGKDISTWMLRGEC